MRYPSEEGNKSDSINISESQLLGFSNSANSSATSGTPASLSQDDDPGASAEANNIATISEHVLFGNNNGQNSFLYLYYSSTGDNSAADNRRPFTARGSDEKVGRVGKVMGSQKQWNDLSGGLRASERGRGSAGPTLSPSFLNNNDDKDDKYGGKTIKPINRIINNDNTPYPVYNSPEEGNHQVSNSPSPTKMGGKRKRDRYEMETIQRNREDRSRPESLTAGLLDDYDDDWDKISPVPDVNPRYIYTPEGSESGRKKGHGESDRGRIVGSEPRLTASHRNGNLGVSKSNLKSSANSLSTDLPHNHQNPSRSLKSVRVISDTGHEGGGGRGSRKNTSLKKLSPVSSTPSTSSTQSLKRVNPNSQHGVTHHHHQPHTGSSFDNNTGANNANKAKRVSTANTGDGIDQMSFLNGIGAYFGTPASRKLSQNHDATPEEIYQQELQGRKPRLATAGMIITATLFILSCSSLLFVFPILVDPILVGLEAQFSPEPVMCRTTLFRNGSGSSECAIPSCREGCTLDLFSCMFIHVEYTPLAYNGRLDDDDLQFVPLNASTINSSLSIPQYMGNLSTKQGGILLININGCGYPPEVTCSDFQRKYGSINSQYPCHYSQQNSSIAVPHYNRNTELFHLTLAVCIPVGVVVLSGFTLYGLVRYRAYLKTTIYRKYLSRKRALKEKNGKDTEEEGDMDDDEGKDATSVSELDIDEEYDYDFKEIHYPYKNNEKVLNGASKTGMESRTMLRSSQM